MDYYTIYKDLLIYQSFHMTVAWIICCHQNNGSYVDLAWPSGFTIMAIQFLLRGEGELGKKLLIVIPFLLCGVRFMKGWIVDRQHHKFEDTRWNLWREKWKNGKGTFGIKSIAIKFFFFYHCQSLGNVTIISLPLILICNNRSDITALEWIGLLIWVASFIFEIISDYQLDLFKAKSKADGTKGVMRTGLWAYSRHPNYFFEFMLWVAYAIMTFPNVVETWQYFLVIYMPISMLWVLVDFTGIPMCEKQSLINRGEPYKKYQEEVSMFIPWFPKTSKNARYIK